MYSHGDAGKGGVNRLDRVVLTRSRESGSQLFKRHFDSTAMDGRQLKYRQYNTDITRCNAMQFLIAGRWEKVNNISFHQCNDFKVS